MRTIGYMLLLMIAHQMVEAQSHSQMRLKTLDFDEWKADYPTVDEKGRLIHAVHVSELEVYSKWCLQQPVRISFHSTSGRSLKNAGWYEWNPVRKCWIRRAVPKYVASEQKNGEGSYTIDVNCPGVYGLFFNATQAGSSIVFKAPPLHKLRKLQIRQNEPGISWILCPEEPLRSITLPKAELHFSAEIEAEIENPAGEIYTITKTLLGGVCDIDDLYENTKRRVVHLPGMNNRKSKEKRDALDSHETELTHNN